LTPERLLVCFRPPPFAKPGNETMLADGSAMSEPHCRPPEKLMVELAPPTTSVAVEDVQLLRLVAIPMSCPTKLPSQATLPCTSPPLKSKVLAAEEPPKRNTLKSDVELK